MNNRFTGLDIGTSCIKAVEIEAVDGGFKVLSLQKCPTPAGPDEELVTALKGVIPSSHGKVIASVGGDQVIYRIVRFPLLSGKELEAAVSYEMERFLPSPAEQMIIRHVCLGTGQEGTGQDVLLLAVSKAAIYHYYKLLSRAGLVVEAVDLSAFALWRIYGRKTIDSRAIIDLGAKFTTIIIVKKGVIKLVRVLPNHRESLDAGLNGVAEEIRRSLIYYANQEETSVERVILSGGGSKQDGLPGFAQTFLGVPVQVGKPAVPPVFAVAAGLALREVMR